MPGLDDYAVVYVDVDGCLLDWGEPKPGRAKPGITPKVNQLLALELRRWYENRAPIIRGRENRFLALWSRNGPAHCRYAARLAGITDIVDAYLPKPYAMIDDAFGWQRKVVRFFQDMKPGP